MPWMPVRINILTQPIKQLNNISKKHNVELKITYVLFPLFSKEEILNKVLYKFHYFNVSRNVEIFNHCQIKKIFKIFSKIIS